MATKGITKARLHGESCALELLAKYRPKQAPIPVKEIAVSEGCLVNGLVLEDELSGMAFVRNNRPVIIFNSSHHQNRQRFTIAHELAHHIMHRSMMSEGVHVDKGVLRRDFTSSMAIDSREVEANAFAATLLMPEDLVLRYANTSIDMEDDQMVARLAKIFGVSSAAFTNRLLNLSLG